MKKLVMVAATVLLFLMLLSSVSAEGAVAPEITPEKNDTYLFTFSDPQEIFSDTYALEPTSPPIQEWTYPISESILEDPLDVIRLVNKINLLDSKYPPDDEVHQMVSSDLRKTSSSERKMRKIAHDALKLLFEAAESDGIKLYLHSAYRGYSTQATMYANRMERIGRDDGVVQSPGASEHQTGLGVDVISKEWIDESRLNERFALTKEAQWMAQNCARFGFIIRYPQGKEDITGITFEPWHLRFVGIDVAMYMTNEGLTLEEFTDEWRAALYTYTRQGGGTSGVNDFIFTEVGSN